MRCADQAADLGEPGPQEALGRGHPGIDGGRARGSGLGRRAGNGARPGRQRGGPPVPAGVRRERVGGRVQHVADEAAQAARVPLVFPASETARLAAKHRGEGRAQALPVLPGETHDGVEDPFQRHRRTGGAGDDLLASSSGSVIGAGAGATGGGCGRLSPTGAVTTGGAARCPCLTASAPDRSRMSPTGCSAPVTNTAATSPARS